jgi:hypothetical protein
MTTNRQSPALALFARHRNNQERIDRTSFQGGCGNQKLLSSHSSLISLRYQRTIRGDQPQGYSGFATGIGHSNCETA